MDAERTRKNSSAILQAISRVGQNTISARTGLSETKVSRIKSDGVHLTLDEIAKFLAAADLKCVPVDMHCYKPESIQALMTLAKERMDELETPDQLVWED